MNKKAYTSPAMVSVALNVTSHLMEISSKGQKVQLDGDKSGDVSGAATKGSGSWGVWDDNDD